MSANEINFKYIFNYTYNPTYVNGAQGGVSPRGEIVIHFYLERPPLPHSIQHELTPAGTIGRELASEPEELANTLVRFVDTGVVMDYANASRFHDWLGSKLKELEEMHAAQAAFAQLQGTPNA